MPTTTTFFSNAASTVSVQEGDFQTAVVAPEADFNIHYAMNLNAAFATFYLNVPITDLEGTFSSVSWTSDSKTLSNQEDLTDAIYDGYTVSGTGIQAGTTLVWDSGTELYTLDTVTTDTGTGITVTSDTAQDMTANSYADGATEAAAMRSALITRLQGDDDNSGGWGVKSDAAQYTIGSTNYSTHSFKQALTELFAGLDTGSSEDSPHSLSSAFVKAWMNSSGNGNDAWVGFNGADNCTTDGLLYSDGTVNALWNSDQLTDILEGIVLAGRYVRGGANNSQSTISLEQNDVLRIPVDINTGSGDGNSIRIQLHLVQDTAPTV